MKQHELKAIKSASNKNIGSPLLLLRSQQWMIILRIVNYD